MALTKVTEPSFTLSTVNGGSITCCDPGFCVSVPSSISISVPGGLFIASASRKQCEVKKVYPVGIVMLRGVDRC